MEQTILRSSVLEEVRKGDPFDMVVVGCDRKRGTGGELISVKQWQKIDILKEAGKSKKSKVVTLKNSSKNPNHWENKTLNIFNPNNKSLHPIKIHIRLIQLFNGKRVVNG